MQTTPTKVLLSSGGMDSFLLAMHPELTGAIHLFVDVGQPYRDKERVAAMAIAEQMGAVFKEVKTLNMAPYEHESGIIPFRNAEMILCAAQFGQDIYLGVIAEEINSDKSMEFCSTMQAVLNISHRKQYWTQGKTFRVLTPFRFDTKSELVARYLDEGNSLQFLLKSVSCYDAGGVHCGRCSSCFKRWVALANACMGTDFAAWGFAQDPATWKSKDQWHDACKRYSDKRAREIFSALAFDNYKLSL